MPPSQARTVVPSRGRQGDPPAKPGRISFRWQASRRESARPPCPAAARSPPRRRGGSPATLTWRRSSSMGKLVPVDVGRTRRLIKPAQRDALIARDKGCAFPNYHMPARWADAHHIHHSLDGGNTDLDNLVLLRRRHHRLIHHSEWSVTI